MASAVALVTVVFSNFITVETDCSILSAVKSQLIYSFIYLIAALDIRLLKQTDKLYLYSNLCHLIEIFNNCQLLSFISVMLFDFIYETKRKKTLLCSNNYFCSLSQLSVIFLLLF